MKMFGMDVRSVICSPARSTHLDMGTCVCVCREQTVSTMQKVLTLVTAPALSGGLTAAGEGGGKHRVQPWAYGNHTYLRLA